MPPELLALLERVREADSLQYVISAQRAQRTALERERDSIEAQLWQLDARRKELREQREAARTALDRVAAPRVHECRAQLASMENARSRLRTWLAQQPHAGVVLQSSGEVLSGEYVLAAIDAERSRLHHDLYATTLRPLAQYVRATSVAAPPQLVCLPRLCPADPKAPLPHYAERVAALQSERLALQVERPVEELPPEQPLPSVLPAPEKPASPLLVPSSTPPTQVPLSISPSLPPPLAPRSLKPRQLYYRVSNTAQHLGRGRKRDESALLGGVSRREALLLDAENQKLLDREERRRQKCNHALFRDSDNGSNDVNDTDDDDDDDDSSSEVEKDAPRKRLAAQQPTGLSLEALVLAAENQKLIEREARRQRKQLEAAVAEEAGRRARVEVLQLVVENQKLLAREARRQLRAANGAAATVAPSTPPSPLTGTPRKRWKMK